jgi:hypothetical protein
VICTLFIHGHRFTFKHLCWHSITKILRNGPKAHFPFNRNWMDYHFLKKQEASLPYLKPIYEDGSKNH